MGHYDYQTSTLTTIFDFFPRKNILILKNCLIEFFETLYIPNI